MKFLLRALTFATCLLVSNLCAADVLYSFSGFFSNINHQPDETDFTGTFDVRLPQFIDHDMVLAAADTQSCHTGNRPCFSVEFYTDALAHGWSADSVPVIRLLDWNDSHSGPAGAFYYYFPAPALSTPGSYHSLYGFDPAVLTVSAVPEPASVFMLLSGLLLVAVARGRKRSR